MLLRLLLPLLCLLPCCAARAHDVWLSPIPNDGVGVGDLVKVELWQGHTHGAEPLARPASRLQRLQALGPGGETVELPGISGRRPAGVFRPKAPGTWRVVYEGRPSLHRLEAGRFEQYLDEEGLAHVLAERRRRSSTHEEGRELVSRSLKALVRIGDATLSDRPSRLPVELVLERIAGDTVELRLLVAGRPAEGVLVDLQALDRTSLRLEARTTAEGVVSFRFESSSGPGRWMAAAVLARPSTSVDAAWRTFFTTLTFTTTSTTPSPAAPGPGSARAEVP